MFSTHSIARFRWWIAAWLWMSMGVALAAPLVKPPLLDVVCSSAGSMKLVAHGGEGLAGGGAMEPSCLWCLLGAAPVPTALALPSAAPAAASLPALSTFARAPAAASAPPPARGPPVFS